MLTWKSQGTAPGGRGELARPQALVGVHGQPHALRRSDQELDKTEIIQKTLHP